MIEGKVNDDDGVSVYDDDNFDGGVVDILARN